MHTAADMRWLAMSPIAKQMVSNAGLGLHWFQASKRGSSRKERHCEPVMLPGKLCHGGVPFANSCEQAAFLHEFWGAAAQAGGGSACRTHTVL